MVRKKTYYSVLSSKNVVWIFVSSVSYLSTEIKVCLSLFELSIRTASIWMITASLVETINSLLANHFAACVGVLACDLLSLAHCTEMNTSSKKESDNKGIRLSPCVRLIQNFSLSSSNRVWLCLCDVVRSQPNDERNAESNFRNWKILQSLVCRLSNK